MCNRPSQVIPAIETLGIVESKQNVPEDLVVRIKVKPCADFESHGTWLVLTVADGWQPCEKI